MRDIGKTIQILRQARRIGLTELAEKAAISVPYLSLIENGKRTPALDVLRRISAALDVPSDVLVLLASPESSLRTDDVRARRMMDAIRRLEEAELAVRNSLESAEGGRDRASE